MQEKKLKQEERLALFEKLSYVLNSISHKTSSSHGVQERVKRKLQPRFTYSLLPHSALARLSHINNASSSWRTRRSDTLWTVVLKQASVVDETTCS